MKLGFKKITRYVVICILLISIIVLVLSLLFDKISTVYNISATSEVVKYKTLQKPISRTNLYNAKVYGEYHSYLDEYELLFNSFSGNLELMDSIDIYVERISNGNLILEINCDDCKSVGNFYSIDNNSKVRSAGEYLYIEISNIDSLINSGRTIILPISGEIILGSSIEVEINNQASPVLRKGEIVMTGTSSWSGEHFIAGSEKLYLGDKLNIEKESGFGFITVNENPALQVSFRVKAKTIKIQKPGPKEANSGYTISASIYDRFLHDQLFQRLSLVFAMIVIATSIGDFLINFSTSKGK